MLDIQLSPDYEKKLEQIALSENVPTSEFIKEILQSYVDGYFRQQTPYELGKDLFGKYGSGKGSLSKDYKKLLKEKLREKHSH